MEKKLTNLEVQEFLYDFEINSETIILEEGSKEKNELEKIAEARGIKIKGSRDLAIFKTIYAFTDQPNSNGAILPKKELLRVLPQIVGKPVNKNHIRNYVMGSYIDYRYKQKENKIIAYQTFFKSNFPKEFEKAQKLLKKKKLSSSFEIWSPKDKRKYREDGSFEMYQMEIAGGALIYEDKDNEPAFKNAKVLAIAKDAKESKLELVYASKHKEDEIITSAGETIMKSNKGSFKKGRFITKKELMETKPNKENTQIEAPKIVTKIKCSNCSEEFDYNGIDIQIKCPKCFAILNKEGTMQYPPQIKDFKLLCPSCRTGRWLILSRKENTAKLRCSQCSKEYNVIFEKAKTNDAISKISFVYTSTVSCPQCGKSIYIAGISGMDNRMVKCGKCKLEFAYNIKDERYKRISKIEEVIPNKENKIDSKKESSEEGGQKMAKEKKVEKASEKKVDEDIKEFAEGFGKLVEKEMVKAKEASKTTGKVEEPKAKEKSETKAKEVKEEKVEVKKEQAKEKPEVKAEAKEAPKAEEPKVKEKIKPKKEAKVETTEKKAVTDKAKETNEETTKEKAESITKVETPKEEKPIEARFEYEVEDNEIFEDIDIAQEKFNCSCVECGHKMTSTEHCATFKCPKCGGQMRRAERPGNDKPSDKAKKLTTEQRNALPDSMFAVVVKVKNKRTGKTRKIRMYPINDEAHVRNALARLGQPKPKATLKRLGVSIEAVRRKILRRARQLKMTQLLERYKKGIKKIANKVKELRKEKASLENKVKLYADNAKTIIERREELGEDCELTDKDILNNDKFEKAKLEKENLLLKANEEKTDELVGSKKKGDDYYTKKRKKIDNCAFGKVNKAHKNK